MVLLKWFLFCGNMNFLGWVGGSGKTKLTLGRLGPWLIMSDDDE